MTLHDNNYVISTSFRYNMKVLLTLHTAKLTSVSSGLDCNPVLLSYQRSRDRLVPILSIGMERTRVIACGWYDAWCRLHYYNNHAKKM